MGLSQGISSAASGVRDVTLERAIVLATEAHADQVDKAGAPYILHPLRVMIACQTDDERIVAVMHDVMEDCPGWPPERLLGEGFSSEQVAALLLLTNWRGSTYDEFIERVATNPLALHVKLADLRDNMNLSRLKVLTERDRIRQRKYARAVHRLIAVACTADTTPAEELPGRHQDKADQ